VRVNLRQSQRRFIALGRRVAADRWDYGGPYARGSGFRLWDARMIRGDALVTGEWL